MVATKGAIIPAAVGVDIGCGMMAVQTTLKAEDLPDSLADIRTQHRARRAARFREHAGRAVRGSWEVAPNSVISRWRELAGRLEAITSKHEVLSSKNPQDQLGTLGGGNHFIEVCVDTGNTVWVMLHSGSRGIGNRIGQYFIEVAREDMRRHFINLPDRDLAYLVEGTEHFDDYVEAMQWAQDYAAENRRAMMDAVLRVLREEVRRFQLGEVAVNCHHNYTTRERHFGEDVLVTRKGAVRAGRGRARDHPGLDGCAFLHRARARQRGQLRKLQPRRGTHDVAHGGASSASRSRITCGHRGRRVPQGQGRHRRDAGRVQGHRRGDGGAEAIWWRSLTP